MSYAEQLWELLAPLGVYQGEGPFQGGELKAQGAALDACAEDLEEMQREMCLVTAQGWGLDKIKALLRRPPPGEGAAQMREALAALLRIGDGSFTLQAINDNIVGCGVGARVTEGGEPGRVVVAFPGVPGIPDDFPEASRIILDILPCHLAVDFSFWYITWRELEAQFASWKALEEKALTWRTLEKSVIGKEETGTEEG